MHTQMLEINGVSKERARNVANGIDVLVTRMAREIHDLKVQLGMSDTAQTTVGQIRVVAGVEPRVETGPVQFGDDWPGIFIRGDNAFGFCMYLDGPEPFKSMAIEQLRRILSGSDLTGISQKSINKPDETI